jgi:hypothetical protein
MIKLFIKDIFFVLMFLLFFSCENTPSIIFTSKKKKKKFYKDEDIEVKVIIADVKNKKPNVQLFVDHLFIDELSNTPYLFTIPAGTVQPGKHFLKIRTMGVDSLRTITINEASSESDDYVTFTDGIIPPEWSVKDWMVSVSEGYDDNFSLFAIKNGAQVTTHKICSNIQFFLKGNGTIYLYMDDFQLPWQTITLNLDSKFDIQPQIWTLYEFECPYFFHTFTWELGSGRVNFDAIRFAKE